MDERVEIGVSLVHCILVELPRLSEQDVAGLHGDNVAKHLVLVLTDAERYDHLLANKNYALISKPPKRVWMRMLGSG